MSTQPTASVATTPRVWRFALLTLAFAVMGACTSSGDAESPTGPPVGDSSSAAAEPAPAPEEIADPGEAAIAAYERYWRTVAESGAVPDPDYGPLSQVASGAALETAQQLAQDALEAGERTEGGPLHDAAVTESYPSAAPHRFVVTDCMDSSEWPVLEAVTGEPVEGEEYGTGRVEALVEQIDDQWLVTEVVILGLGTCLGKRSDSDPPP